MEYFIIGMVVFIGAITYTVWKPNTSRIFTDVKKAIKFAAYPASTPTGQELREWFKSFDVKVPVQTKDEPNDNTKMIT